MTGEIVHTKYIIRYIVSIYLQEDRLDGADAQRYLAGTGNLNLCGGDIVW